MADDHLVDPHERINVQDRIEHLLAQVESAGCNGAISNPRYFADCLADALTPSLEAKARMLERIAEAAEAESRSQDRDKAAEYIAYAERLRNGRA